jgi:hypothetical protein
MKLKTVAAFRAGVHRIVDLISLFLKSVTATRLIGSAVGLVIWIVASWGILIFSWGGKRQESWCNHQGAPDDWTVTGGQLIRVDGPPSVLRCDWDTPSGGRTVNYELWPLTILDVINTALWCSIPELLLWAVWLAWNKRQPVPSLVTRVFQIVGALWLLVIFRELGYPLRYLY